MPQSIASAVAKLKTLRAELAEPVEFFNNQLETAHVALAHFHAAAAADAGKWVGIARQTALDLLLIGRPADQDPAEWELIANYVAARVSMLPAPGGAGVVIFLGPNQMEFGFASALGEAAPVAAGLSLEHITEYVEAGLRGDALGKPDISEHDVARTAQQTAFNLLLAFRKRNFAGAREAEVIQFVQARVIQATDEFFPAIRAAWVEVFSVVAPRDFANWCAARARAILA